MRRVFGALTDVLVLLLAVAALVVIARKQSWFRPKPATPEAFFRVGQPLTGTSLDFSKAETNLVFVLSPQCKFCTASADFYRRLLEAGGQKEDTRFIALFRQDATEGRSYLDGLGLQADRIAVVGSSLNYHGKSVGTPTLLLVSREGVVSKAWVGKLGQEQESEVFSALDLHPGLARHE